MTGILRSSDEKNRGFTLIEVVISLAVISTALVSIMGLLMLALSQSQEAASETIGAQISTKLMGEMQMLPWKEVDDFAHPAGGSTLHYRYFNEFGEEITSQNESIFTAAIVLNPTTDPISLQTAPVNLSQNNHLRKAVVYVAASPGLTGANLISSSIGSTSPTDSRLAIHSSLLTHFEKDE